MTGRPAPLPKAMNKPFTEPSQCVRVGDRFYEINTDFRVWIEISQNLERDDLSDFEKICMLLVLGYKKELPESIDGATDALFDFFSMGKRGSAPQTCTQILSFSQDEGFIYAAFMQQYGIDLYKENMHWHKFLQLLNSLGEDCAIVRIMGYRSMKTGDIKNSKERKFYENMKRKYRLHKKINDTDIANALDLLT